MGAGDGLEVKLLKDAGVSFVHGVSFYEEEFKNVGELGVKDYMHQADIHDLPFKDNTYDFVFSKETLEHTIAPHIALYEINRVMKTDARFIHMIPSGAKKQMEWYHYFCLDPWQWIDVFHKCHFEVEKISREFGQNAYWGKKKEDVKWTEPVEMINLLDDFDRLKTW